MASSQPSIAPAPVTTPLCDKTFVPIKAWATFFAQVYRELRSWTLALTAQTAALATTTLLMPQLPSTPAGLFRVSYYARVTTAAGTSSSLQVTIGWTDGGVACTRTFTAITGNTTATTDAQGILVSADNASSITIATAYASNPAAAMVYSLTARVEPLPVGVS